MSSSLFPKLILKPGREKSIERFHPWIFSGAINHCDSDLESGDSVEIFSASGQSLAIGAFSPKSQIRCRIWEFSSKNKIKIKNESDLLDVIYRRIQRAVDNRNSDLNLAGSNAFRLIHAESDQLPGLIADKYHDIVVLQLSSSGVEKYRDEITDMIVKLTEAHAVYERSDVEVRNLEGLPMKEGFLSGESPSETAEIYENGLKYTVNFISGHKTGFYLDQRDNRLRVRRYSNQKDVLDCFSYTGGFSLNALAGGAKSVTSVDLSDSSLKQFKENVELNGYSEKNLELLQADVFKQLRLFRDQGKEYDLIILDPPKFAPTRKQVNSAARGYKDINLIAMKLLRPGGILFTFSCSGGVDQGLFQKIIAGAAVDAGVDLQFVERMTQASDHSVLSSFPEGEYLKGIICRKI